MEEVRCQKKIDHKGFLHCSAQRDSHCYVVHHVVETGAIEKVKQTYRSRLAMPSECLEKAWLIGVVVAEDMVVPHTPCEGGGRTKAGGENIHSCGEQIFQALQKLDSRIS